MSSLYSGNTGLYSCDNCKDEVIEKYIEVSKFILRNEQLIENEKLKEEVENLTYYYKARLGLKHFEQNEMLEAFGF